MVAPTHPWAPMALLPLGDTVARDPCLHVTTGHGTWQHPQGGMWEVEVVRASSTKEWQEPEGLQEQGSSLASHAPHPCALGPPREHSGCRRTPRGTSQPAAPQGCASPVLPLPHNLSMGETRSRCWSLHPLERRASRQNQLLFTARLLSQTQHFLLSGYH